MKKTILVLLVALLLVPAGLFADGFDFSIGATAQYTNAFDATNTDQIDWESFADIENYGFGADMRLRILFAELDIAALYSQGEIDGETLHSVTGLVTGGVSLDLIGLLRVGLGMGPRINVLFNDAGDVVVFNETQVITADTDFAEAFMNAPMTYRATADLKLGGVMVGLNYTVDTDGFTFETMDTTKLAPNFAEGRIGVSALLTLF